jgi:hypothetical protein
VGNTTGREAASICSRTRRPSQYVAPARRSVPTATSAGQPSHAHARQSVKDPIIIEVMRRILGAVTFRRLGARRTLRALIHFYPA